MQKKSNHKIFFICSPSLGILDNWISVIYEMKQSKPDFEYIFFAPNAGSIEQIELDAPLIKIASTVFDKVVFQAYDGLYLSSNSFDEAKKQYRVSNNSFFMSIKKLLPKLRLSFLNTLIDFTFKLIIRKFANVTIFNLQYIQQKQTIVLYDIYESTKKYNYQILSYMNDVKKYSICHGNGINDHLLDGLKANPPIIKNYPNKDTTVFAFSKNDAEYYKLEYGVEESYLRDYGIPRHEQRWMDFFISTCEKEYEIPFDGNYIFIISRRDGTMVPKTKKMKFIQEIKNIADKYKLNIVVKKHPKELNDDSYEKILGVENYGKSWIVSNIHAFFLGKHSKIAVCYFTGVCTDMIVLDTPVIERVDSEDVLINRLEQIKKKSQISIINYKLLIVKTGISDIREEDRFWIENFGFHPDIYDYLIENFSNIRILGFDSISVSSFANRMLGREAHKRFLNPENPILLLEDMNLRDMDENIVFKEIIIAPFRISKCDGLPCTIIGKIND